MLDEKDLNILRAMMQEIVSDSEARMTARIEERVEDTRSMLMAYLESAIEPKLRLLAEGHQSNLETLTPVERTEQLEDEVAFLKPIVLSTRADLDKLKKAQ